MLLFSFSSTPQVRWFVLKAFMERHALVRIFYTDTDVMLFADVTGYVDLHLSRTYVALAKRWDGWVAEGMLQYSRSTLKPCADRLLLRHLKRRVGG